MKYATIAVRILLGLFFTVFGANHWLHFIPLSQEGVPQVAQDFTGILARTGYMDLVKVLEVAGGLLLLVGRFVPLGLVVLTPVIVNIACYDIFLMHKPGPGSFALVLDVILLVAYRKHFLPCFQPGTGDGD